MNFPFPTIDELTTNPERYTQLFEHIEELHEEDQKRNEEFLKLRVENNKLHSQIEDKDKIIEEKDRIIEEKDRINEEKNKIIQEQAEQIKELTKDRLSQEKAISKFYEEDKVHRRQAQTIHSQSEEMFRLVKGNLVPPANKIFREMVHNDHQGLSPPHQPPQHQYSPIINNASHNDAAHFGSSFNFSTPIPQNQYDPFGLEQSSSKHKDSGISFDELNPEEHIDEKTEQFEQRMEQIENKMKQIEEKQKEEKTEIEEKIVKIEEKVEKMDEKVEKRMEQIEKKMEQQQIGEKMGQKEVMKLEKIEEEVEQIEVKIEEEMEQIEEKKEEIEEKPEEIEEKKVHQNEDGNVKMENSMSKAFRWSKLLLMGLLKLFFFVQFFLNFLENTGLYKVIPAEEGGGGDFQLALFMPFVSIEEGPPECL